MGAERLEWKLVPGTPHYETESGWRAEYVRTERGFARYRTTRPDGSNYAVGGLPDVGDAPAALEAHAIAMAGSR